MKYLPVSLIACFFISCAIPAVQLEKAPPNMAAFMSPRTVRVVVEAEKWEKGKLIYAWKEVGHGTGTVLFSSKKFSLVQTANHVLFETPKLEKGVINIRFVLEFRDLENKILRVVNGAKVVERYKEEDLGLLRVEEDLGVNTRIAHNTSIGTAIYILGYPVAPGMRKVSISYGQGYVASRGISNPAISSAVKVIRSVVYSTGGQSGAALYNRAGEIVGITFGSYRVHGTHYGTYAEEMRRVYSKSKYSKYLLR